MCKNTVCNPPKHLVCNYSNCPLTATCRYISSCISRLVSDTLQQYSCACNYTQNGLEVFKLPSCVFPTDAPTISPTNYPTISPTISPTNSSQFGGSIKDDASSAFNEMYYYIIGSVAVVLMCVVIYFRKYFCCKNRVEDNS
jgi:hypothetical protein